MSSSSTLNVPGWPGNSLTPSKVSAVEAERVKAVAVYRVQAPGQGAAPTLTLVGAFATGTPSNSTEI
jgi:hypothetical protein